MRWLILLLIMGGLAAAEDDPVARLEALSAELRAADPAEVARLADRAGVVCRRLLTGEPLPGRDRLGFRLHRVAAGETAVVIARRWRLPFDGLARLNRGTALDRLAPGRDLLVLDARTLRLEARLAARRVLLWRGEHLALSAACGIGRPGHATPTGRTRVAQRVRDPEWRDPDSGKVFRSGDPRNVLGGYWLGFDHGKDRRFAGIGVHGYTAEPAERWLGQESSHGCLRLLQADVEILFALVGTGVEVEVRE